MRRDEEVYDAREVRARYRVEVDRYGETEHAQYWEVVERLRAVADYEGGLLWGVRVQAECAQCGVVAILPGMVRQNRLYTHELLRCVRCNSIWYATHQERVRLWMDYYNRRGVVYDWYGGRKRKRSAEEVEAERQAKAVRKAEWVKREAELRAALVAYIKQRGGSINSASEATRGTGIQESVVQRVLRALVVEGVLRMRGGRTSQGQPYELVGGYDG